MGHFKKMNEQGREIITAYWDYAAFIVNSVLFIGVGVHESFQNASTALGPAILGILLVLLGRAFTVYPCCALFSPTPGFAFPESNSSSYSGEVCAEPLALALAVGLPSGIANREEIISVTFGRRGLFHFCARYNHDTSFTAYRRNILRVSPRRIPPGCDRLPEDTESHVSC